MRPTKILVALTLALAAIPSLAAEPEAPFVSIGEVVYRNSAAYDATRVRGPTVNMSVTKDGEWGGNLLQKDVMLKITPDRISGAGVNLVVTRKPGSLAVEGMINGIRVRVTATTDKFVGRVGNAQVESNRHGTEGWFENAGSGRSTTMRFKADAGKMPDVTMPQWIFAVIGAI
jgi:hypothetical protein